MQGLLDRAASDPSCIPQLLSALTSAASVPRELLPRVLEVLTTETAPLQARQNVFVLVTAECDPNLVPARDAARTLACLLKQTISDGVQFYDNNALFRCLLSLISTPSPLIPASSEFDELVIAVCNYHRVVSLQFIDACSKLQLLSAGVLPDVMAMLCCSSLDSPQPYRVLRIIVSGALRQQCTQTVLKYAGDGSSPERCCGAISLLSAALWGPNRIPDLSATSDAALNQMALLLQRGAADCRILKEICLALEQFVSTLQADCIVEIDQIVDMLRDAGPDLQPDTDPVVAHILHSILKLSEAPSALDIACRYVHLLKDAEPFLDCLLEHQKAKVRPADPSWLDHLTDLMRSFFLNADLPESIRHSSFLFAVELVSKYRSLFADSILRSSVLPFCTELPTLSEAAQISIYIELEKVAGSFAMETFTDLVEVLRSCTDSKYDSVRDLTVAMLRNLLSKKFPHPSYEHSILLFDVLIQLISHTNPRLRQQAIEALSGIGANRDGTVRYIDCDTVVTSSYVFVGSRYHDERTSTVLALSEFVDALSEVVKSDRNPNVLQAALQAVRGLCSDVIVSAEIDVAQLCSVLSTYLKCNQFGEQLQASKDQVAARCVSAYEILSNLLAYRHRFDINVYDLAADAFVTGLDTHAQYFADDHAVSCQIAAVCLRALILIALDKPELIAQLVSKILSSFSSSRDRNLDKKLMQFLHSFLSGILQEKQSHDGQNCSVSSNDMLNVFKSVLQLLLECTGDAFQARLAYRCLRFCYLLCTSNDRLLCFDEAKTRSKSNDVEMTCLLEFMYKYLHSSSLPRYAEDSDSDFLSDCRTDRSRSWITPASIITISASERKSCTYITIRSAIAPNSSYTLNRADPLQSCDTLPSTPERTMNLLKVLTGSESSSHVQPLENGEQLERSLAVLDQISHQETMKIGVVYVGPGQVDEPGILHNVIGSRRYHKVLKQLGQALVLKGTKSYTGGLDRHSDNDGRLTLQWLDPCTQICFHVATMMPNRSNAARGEHKKRHIGNDFVNIIYNDNIDFDYDPDTLSSQLNFVQIVVQHVSDELFSISSNIKPNVPEFWFIQECRTFHISFLGRVLKQLIVQAQIACWVMQPQKLQEPAWQVRYQQIQRIAGRHTISSAPSPSSSSIITT